MAHSFLMEGGKWSIEGYWIDKGENPIKIKGRTLIVWKPDNWFNMVTKLVFPKHEKKEDITFQYKGRLEVGESYYTYFLTQTLLGKVEGEGLIGVDSIIQRYWVLSDRQRRNGFDTYYRADNNTYHYSGGIRTGISLISMVEATLTRQT